MAAYCQNCSLELMEVGTYYYISKDFGHIFKCFILNYRQLVHQPYVCQPFNPGRANGGGRGAHGEGDRGRGVHFLAWSEDCQRSKFRSREKEVC